MIKTERLQINGTEFVKTYSDKNMMIERDGAVYSEAIDPIGSGRTYTETETPVPKEDDVQSL